MKFKPLKRILIFSLLLLISVGSFAQEQPTPFAPIIIQSSANVGVPEPFAVSEIAIRNGLSEWLARGWSGHGIKIGVLDRGFGGLDSFSRNFNVTVAVAPGADTANYQDSSIIHGTQVLETIHAVAPGAELFVCAYDNLPNFDLCVTWMIRSGVNIINHSVGVPALPLDGTTPWAQEVDRAARENILWVNAAGNFAQGYFTDRFTDTQPNGLHEFRAIAPENNEALGVATIEATGDGLVMLSWSGYAGKPANAIDLDLQVIDLASGQIIEGSYDKQAGLSSDQPIEYLPFNHDRPYAIQVIDNSGDAVGVEFVLFIAFASVPTTRSQGSIIAPADSQNSFTVGALQGIRLAPYSSRGQLDNGLIGIDLVAPGEVQLRDGVFIGTSAAAPIVAASAALVWEANPNFTARDVSTYLENAAIDDPEFPGRDNNYGFGILDLPLPNTSPQEVAVLPTSEPTTQPTDTPRPQPTATDRPTNTPPPQPTSTTAAVSSGATVTINVSSANLRTGPGTNYNIAGTANSEQTFDVIARYEDWYLVDRGSQSDAWVWSGIVDLNGNDSGIQIVATIPPTPANATSQASQGSGTSNGFSISQIGEITHIGDHHYVQLRVQIPEQYVGVELFLENGFVNNPFKVSWVGSNVHFTPTSQTAEVSIGIGYCGPPWERPSMIFRGGTADHQVSINITLTLNGSVFHPTGCVAD
jgi:hypothetical protein